MEGDGKKCCVYLAGPVYARWTPAFRIIGVDLNYVHYFQITNERVLIVI